MSLLTHPDLIFLRLNQSNVDSAARIERYSVSLADLSLGFTGKFKNRTARCVKHRIRVNIDQ